MNRIGTTSQGGILMEMTPEDINRFQQAMAALADLLVQGANHGINLTQVDPCPPVKIEDAVIVAPPLARKQARKYVRKAKTVKTAAKHLKAGVVAGCPSRICLTCGEGFVPSRKDSLCCSKKCNSERHRKLALKPAVKPDAKAPQRTVINEDIKAKRLELIRKLANKGSREEPIIKESGLPFGNLDDVTEFRQARMEASRE